MSAYKNNSFVGEYVREMVVAGLFYPLGNQLTRMLETFFENTKEVEQATGVGVVSPHAGYVYSGQTAAFAYSALTNINSCSLAVVLGPNHTGLGSPLSLSLLDWESPFGIVENAKEIGLKLLESYPPLAHDELAHMKEHSIEVQLPFLKYLNKDIKIVPICMGEQSSDTSIALAEALHKILPKDAIIIASSDFSHYVPLDTAMREDKKAIDLICKLDVEDFNKERFLRGWSICGYGPIMTAMHFSKLRGCRDGRLIYYDTSATASGNTLEVVGYGAIGFFIS